MIDSDLLELIDSVMGPLGASEEDGEEFRSPPLDVLKYYRRPVKVGVLPIVGRALGIVAVVRQPVDVTIAGGGYRELVRRVAMAAHGRFPPVKRGAGLSLGLTVVVATPEPITPEDDDLLKVVLEAPGRMRAVPLGLLRVNLGQEACAFALRPGPAGLFPEPEALADAFAEKLRRFAKNVL